MKTNDTYDLYEMKFGILRICKEKELQYYFICLQYNVYFLFDNIDSYRL